MPMLYESNKTILQHCISRNSPSMSCEISISHKNFEDEKVINDKNSRQVIYGLWMV